MPYDYGFDFLEESKMQFIPSGSGSEFYIQHPQPPIDLMEEIKQPVRNHDHILNKNKDTNTAGTKEYEHHLNADSGSSAIDNTSNYFTFS